MILQYLIAFALPRPHHKFPDTPMNPQIQQAREVATNILNPTPKDLDHGLALHTESVVVESYSLGIMAPMDGDRMAAAIESGATDLELQDLGEDMRMTGWANDPSLRDEYEEIWKASGVTCSYQNAGEEGNDPLRLIKRLARHTYVADKMPDLLKRVTHPDDIVAAKAEGKHCRYLTGNGIPLAGDQVNTQEELRFIRVFYQLGVRMMHLTYNRRNPIGDGCGESADAGLSEFGLETIREMNRVGVLIDIAHSGRQTGLDAARASERPIVISHSCAASLNEHIRCKDDETIQAVIDSGGSMGITNVPHFLGGKGDISAMLDHIDYVARTFGADHVTIGTDRSYTSHQSAAENAKVPKCRQIRDRWEALWPEGSRGTEAYRQDHQAQSLMWTNWPLITVGLVQRGYSDEDIRKIIGENILRVSRDVLN
ncbi:TPA: dipeptidase [Candidatus Latescibacteria bacterium]|nr:dipeptidase [Candidatus Latescibacterota bacterium]